VSEAETSISWLPFDPRGWEQLTPAFGRLKSMVAPTGSKLVANKRTATFFDRNVHEGQLELALEVDGMYRLFDAAERRKLHIRVPLNYEEGCSIEPDYDGTWHARCSDLDRLTTTPSPAAGAEAEIAPARISPAEPASALPAEPSRVEPEPPSDELARDEPELARDEPELARDEPTRWQRDRAIKVIKTLLPGRHPPEGRQHRSVDQPHQQTVRVQGEPDQ
jgi:hypothetical protein